MEWNGGAKSLSELFETHEIGRDDLPDLVHLRYLKVHLEQTLLQAGIWQSIDEKNEWR